MKRRCEECGIEISKCMGFVNAGDFINYEPGKKIRELCAKCGLKYLYKKFALVDRQIDRKRGK